jgi:uncharacterized membrane protein
MTKKDVSRFSLAGFMVVAGSAHFVFPRYYERIVPRVLGHQRFWVRASGIAEFGCAAMLAGRRTSSLGGWTTAALFAIVFPANVQMALDSLGNSESPASSAVLAWIRLPLQIPLIVWAASVARSDHASGRLLDRPQAGDERLDH